MAIGTYSTGTVSVSVGGTVVTGVGTSWTSSNVKSGDDIVIAGHQVMVTGFTDATHLTILAWPSAYGAVSGGSYAILQRSPERFGATAVMSDVSKIISSLSTQGYVFFVSSVETVPNPSYGADGQYAYQPTTKKWWVKTGGVWTVDTGPGTGDMKSALNLSDLANAATARTNLGVPGLAGANTFSGAQTAPQFLTSASGVVLQSYVGGGASYLGTTSNHPLTLQTNNLNRIVISATGDVSFTSTTASTSTTTGALTVAGGLGVAGDLNWGGATPTSYSPSLTSSGGAVVVDTANGTYKKLGKLVWFNAVVNYTSGGSGQLRVGLPTTPIGSFAYLAISISGNQTAAAFSNNTNYATLTKADGTYPTAGSFYAVTGWYSE